MASQNENFRDFSLAEVDNFGVMLSVFGETEYDNFKLVGTHDTPSPDDNLMVCEDLR